ncbi:MAG: GntR family transcriptional regulator [Chloroflexi bacterium]|nr:GntR family transcriptional regulator [Chloroflexota bacterium]
MKLLKFSLDFRSGIPSYIQIVEQVQAFLASGDLRPGDQLPTVRQLASELRINFNTIARAYRILDETGVISTQRGRGTYLLEKPSPERVQQLRKETLEFQIERFIRSLKQQGFFPEQTDAVIQFYMQTWKNDMLGEDNDTAI